MGSFFQKAYHARLHKLFQFVHFGASTIDEDLREERIFVMSDVEGKRWEGSKVYREIFISRDVSKVEKITKGVRRRNLENFSTYAICKLKNEFALFTQYGLFLVKRDAKASFLPLRLVSKKFRVERLSRVAVRPSLKGTRSEAERSCTGIAREELGELRFVSEAN